MEYRKVCDELDARISANLAADQRFAGEVAHDLADLRRKLATVYDDKHQRAAEVSQLQLEGSQLQNKLAQEIDDRAAACNFLGRSLAVEASQSEQVVRELRTTTSVSLRLHRNATFDDTNVLHNQMQRLEQGLDRAQQISSKVIHGHCLEAGCLKDKECKEESRSRSVDRWVRELRRVSARN